MKRIATIGFFDGVHKGHCFLFEQLRSLATQRGLLPLIVTFDRHPRTVLQSDYTPQLLTTVEERESLLSPFGEVLMLPFEKVQPLTAAEFMQRLKEQYDVTVLLMGYDHMFGSDRLRHPQEYKRLGEQFGIEVITMNEFVDGEWHVSSTEIRQALLNGNIMIANDLLGRPYSLTGRVVSGRGIGRTIGFPTANIQPEDTDKIIPQNGVYEILITNESSSLTNHHSSIVNQMALCNIGTNPTVGNTTRTIEVYIPNFEGDIYDCRLTLRFVRFIREEQKFDSLQTLQKQITEDLASVIH